MKAVVYKEPFRVAVEKVADPKIEHPNDVIVKITSTAICGSDLHMYEGRTAADPGIVFGHENLGIVEETGKGVNCIRKGDRVVMPFNVACGFCKNCEKGYTGFCLTVNEGFAGGAYGYVAMGPYRGGQAEYLRVPYADFNLLKFPDKAQAMEKIHDLTMLSDILPTGFHGAVTAGVARWSPALDVNTGEAAILAPMDRGFPADGVLATTRGGGQCSVAADAGIVEPQHPGQPQAVGQLPLVLHAQHDVGGEAVVELDQGLANDGVPVRQLAAVPAHLVAVDHALLLAQAEAFAERRLLAQHHREGLETVLAHRLAEQEVVALGRLPAQAAGRRQLRTGGRRLGKGGKRQQGRDVQE